MSSITYMSDEATRIFCLSYGAIIWWGLSENRNSNFIFVVSYMHFLFFIFKEVLVQHVFILNKEWPICRRCLLTYTRVDNQESTIPNVWMTHSPPWVLAADPSFLPWWSLNVCMLLSTWKQRGSSSYSQVWKNKKKIHGEYRFRLLVVLSQSDISVFYMTAHRCAVGLKKKGWPTVGLPF